MALSFSSSIRIPKTSPPVHSGVRNRGACDRRSIVKCEMVEKPPRKLEVGSPIVVVEAPKMIKTAAPMPCLRVNSGLVKPGDVGRIVSRKPKDVWAVRLSIGTYLLDGKYFKALELDE